MYDGKIHAPPPSNCPHRRCSRTARGLTAPSSSWAAGSSAKLNQAAQKFDPTSHGEVEAVRDACRNLKTTTSPAPNSTPRASPARSAVATMLMAGIGPDVLRRLAGAIGSRRAAAENAAATTLVRQQSARRSGERSMLPAETKLPGEEDRRAGGVGEEAGEVAAGTPAKAET